MSCDTRITTSITMADLYRLSVKQFHVLIASGSVLPEDRIELIFGFLFRKKTTSPRHRVTSRNLFDILIRILPSGWSVQSQEPVTTEDSEPGPDITVFRGQSSDYLDRHPGPGDVAVVVEVADSSLQRDRTDKLSVYARAGIGTYVIVNLTSNVLEVHTQPDSAGGRYRTVQTLGAGEALALSIPGEAAVEVPVGSVLP